MLVRCPSTVGVASLRPSPRQDRRLDKTREAVRCTHSGSSADIGGLRTLVAKVEAVLEHRRTLIAVRTLTLQHVEDQIGKLPVEIPGQLGTAGKIEGRLRRLDKLPPPSCRLSLASIGCRGCSRWSSWVAPLVVRCDGWNEESAISSTHDTTLRDEPGSGAIAAPTLLAEVDAPYPFARESRFAC